MAEAAALTELLLRYWRGRERCVLLAAGEGALDAALAAWQAWIDDPARCARLHLIAATEAMPRADALRTAAAGRPWAAPAGRLAAALPPPAPGLHPLGFDDGRVQWLLAAGPLRRVLRELQAAVDVFVLDPPGAGDDDPVALAKACARLAAARALLVLARAGTAADDAAIGALRAAGFVDEPAAPGSRCWQACHLRRGGARRPGTGGGPDAATAGPQDALIVGAGLAGCAAAWALAEQGIGSVLIDRHGAPAMEASSNPASIFHGTVNAADGVHARFNRAAALQAQRAVQCAIDAHGVRGAAGGLLRLHAGDPAAMQALLARLGLPPGYVEALNAAAAGRVAGLPLAQPAWHFPGGGWVDPAGLARAFVERAGAATRFRGNTAVAALRRGAQGWQLLDAGARVLAAAPVVVLANAGDALRLLGGEHWPVTRVRGQITLLDLAQQPLRLPRIPVAGSGYLLPALDGDALFGATAQAGDDDPAVRAADHAYNLIRLRHLSAACLADADPPPAALHGRVGWRLLTQDRLPLIGPVPRLDDAALQAQTPLARLPRLPGLHLWAGLGSRGITWAALGAQLLAARISGAPWPLERSLADGVDPARFALRRARRG